MRLRGLILGLLGLILGLRGLIQGLKMPWRPRGGTYGWMDGHLEIHPCVLQDIGPLGPLPKKGPSVPMICNCTGCIGLCCRESFVRPPVALMSNARNRTLKLDLRLVLDWALADYSAWFSPNCFPTVCNCNWLS